jgi:hypothetical protein
VNCQALGRELASRLFSGVPLSFHRSPTVTYLGESAMPSKAEMLRKFSLRRWIMAIAILCISVWWACADTLAQETAPTGLNMTAHSTLWAPEGAGPNTPPYLVIDIAEREEPRSYGLLRLPLDEAANPSLRETISRPLGPMTAVNRAEKGVSGPLSLSSLFATTARARGLTDFPAKETIRHQTIRTSRNPAGAKIYSLLNDSSAPESFLDGYEANDHPSNQWLADNESFPHEVEHATRPLLQLEFGGWRFPVMLSSAAVSR